MMEQKELENEEESGGNHLQVPPQVIQPENLPNRALARQRVPGGGEIKEKKWTDPSKEKGWLGDTSSVANTSSTLMGLPSLSNEHSLAEGLDKASGIKELGKLGGASGKLNTFLGDKFGTGTSGMTDLAGLGQTSEMLGGLGSGLTALNGIDTMVDQGKDLKGGKLKNALARRLFKNAAQDTAESLGTGGLGFGSGLKGMADHMTTSVPILGGIQSFIKAGNAGQKTVDDAYMSEGFRKNKGGIAKDMRAQFSGSATQEEMKQSMGEEGYRKGAAVAGLTGGSLSNRWNRMKFNRAKNKIETKQSKAMKGEFKAAQKEHEKTGTWDHLANTSFKSKESLDDYGEMHGLKSFAKMGHKRKAESATLNAVDTVGQGLQGVGGVAGPHGAPVKLAGKVVSGLKSGYEGGKGAWKRWHRIGKLAEAKNTAGYGGNKERGLGWKVASFLSPFHKQEAQEKTLQASALKGDPNLYKSMGEDGLANRQQAAELMDGAAGQSRYQRVQALAKAKDLTEYGGNSKRDWKWKTKQYLFGGSDLGAKFGRATSDEKGRSYKGLTAAGRKNQEAAKTEMDRTAFGKTDAEGNEMSRLDRVRALADSKNSTGYGGRTDRGTAWKAKMYLFGGAKDKLGLDYRDTLATDEGRLATRTAKAKETRADMHEGDKSKIGRLTTRKLDRATDHLMKVLRTGKGKALGHAKNLVKTVSGVYGKGGVEADQLDLQGKDDYASEDERKDDHARIGEDMGYLKKLISTNLYNG